MEKERKWQEIDAMKRVSAIYEHSLYQTSLAKNGEAEKDRVFCRHNLSHFIDVARLSYIFSLERGFLIPKEEIYAAALLHDIGRWKQYQDGTPHDIASADLAETILCDVGFSVDERARILGAILEHRGRSEKMQDQVDKKQKMEGVLGKELSEILYDADKISRNCYGCPAKEECNWPEEKKNWQIIW